MASFLSYDGVQSRVQTVDSRVPEPEPKEECGAACSCDPFMDPKVGRGRALRMT